MFSFSEISSSIVSISETEYKTSDSKDDLYDKVIEAPLTENSERFTNEMNNIMNSKEIQTEVSSSFKQLQPQLL